ncbi:hypothetical protein QBC44DRAFT_121796 [Cladorrhinum sp. PSN332]|nr:hypothetical protein QBC44DRAFT_121796 [Cladorrhinum sp. PSN332]
MSPTPNRPEFLDLRSKSQASVSRPLRSPRLHIAGEIPPELSPLDAFALQSRLLAKQLQESAKTGRRMSRLPPLTTDSPLIVQARSDYFRSLSHDSASEDDYHQQSASSAPASGFKPEVEDDVSNRPVSVHPRMSRIPPTPDESIPVPTMPNMDSLKRNQGDNRSLKDLKELRDEINEGEGEGFFGVGARREQSPGPIESNPPQEKLSRTTTHDSYAPAEKLSRSTTHDSPAPVGKLSRSTTHDSIPLNSPGPTRSITSSPERIIKQKSFDAAGLIPPRPLFTKRSSSLMSAQLDTTDEEGASTLGTSFHSQGSRKLSTSSSIMSPSFAPYQRSPSIGSDISGLPRPSFNFSRPLSRSGTPSFDSPARQASSDSHASFLFADDSATTPISMTGDGFHDGNAEDGSSNAKPTYNLPRGKALQRDSVIIPNPKPTPARFSWEQPIDPQAQQTSYNTNFQAYQPPPSPPTRPPSSAEPQVASGSRPSQEPSKLSTELFRAVQESSDQPRPSRESARVSSESRRGRAPFSSHDLETRKTSVSGTTSDSASTIKDVRSQNSGAPTMTELSAEEHVTKAIDLHENGSLQESTWHLRHAAKQNHPTGMLLYALACRHGWGMRPNPKEGVDWLRKAVECASLEVKDDEEHIKEGQRVDVAERKTHKAQFALGVYELGVSHMNGWGIDQDKALALKCFEIAAAWGDVDALAETGFCYAQGIGCKKDLKKSAKYYREAEAKGMSMVGNSWIHKAKYSEDPKDSEKARPKSRARKSIFSRKTHS